MFCAFSEFCIKTAARLSLGKCVKYYMNKAKINEQYARKSKSATSQVQKILKTRTNVEKSFQKDELYQSIKISVLNEKMKTAPKYAFSKLSSNDAYKYKKFPQKWKKTCFFDTFFVRFQLQELK